MYDYLVYKLKLCSSRCIFISFPGLSLLLTDLLLDLEDVNSPVTKGICRVTRFEHVT